MAAPFQNYSGGVLLADIVKRNNLSTYVSEAIKERSAFIKSGAVVRNALLDATEGGTRIQVPEFNPIAPTEEILDGTATWGTSNAGYLTPQKIGTGTQIATICHRGFAYAVDDVAVLAAGEDPMGHIRNQIADAINKLNSARLFSLLDGLFATGSGALGAKHLDIAKAGTGADEDNFLNSFYSCKRKITSWRKRRRARYSSNSPICCLLPISGWYAYILNICSNNWWCSNLGWWRCRC